MNERIRDLLLAAGYAAPELAIRAQKLVQLIVRKCAELSVNSRYVNTKSEYYEGFNEALIYAGNKIKKHFGVEE